MAYLASQVEYLKLPIPHKKLYDEDIHTFQT